MKNNLYNWVFRYNPFNLKWYAAKRENYHELWSDTNSPNVLRSNDVETLLYLISKTDGDNKKLNKIVK